MPINLFKKEKAKLSEKPTLSEGEAVVRREIEEAPKPEFKEAIEKKIEKEDRKVTQIKPAVSRIPFLKKKPEIKQSTTKSQTQKKIEFILSEDIQYTYQSLSEDLKRQLKEKGEETATKIEKIISQTKIAVYKIVNLIKIWLMIIPGVNKFFLEQETKIKTGKILELAEKKKTSKQ